MKTILMIVGVLALAIGLIWIGQGLGYITWHPANMPPSFMVGKIVWTYYGAGLAVLGVIVIAWSRR
jgi:hypothetical protein